MSSAFDTPPDGGEGAAGVPNGASIGQSKRRAETTRLDASFLARWLRGSAADIARNRDYLTQLDAAIGDADHGVNMDRGFSAVLSIVESADGLLPGELLLQTGATLVLRVGGAAGPLYGTAFRDAGRALGDRATFGPAELADALEAGLGGITKLGAADEGDKTIVDAWAPALRALRHARSGGLVRAIRDARVAAEAGSAATTPMEARKGRASYLGPRSVGHQDPGATSTALLFAALERAAR
jgi:phosphoenolpyruvate---glycerone phosphotransferase subunit DhaL